MTDEIISTEASHECTGPDCPHNEEQSSTEAKGMFTKHRGSEELALAFLLALTPLVVLTFFGQVGLI